MANISNQKLVKRYLSIRDRSITQKTKKAFKWDLDIFLEYLGDKPLSEVTHIDIDGFLEYCKEERNNGDASLSRKYNTLNMFYKTMIAKEYLDMKNPLDKVERVKVRKKIIGHVSLDEYKQIMTYLDSINDLRGKALISLLYSSAIRVSELHRLNISDLDFDNREFSVLGKGEKVRICVFSEEAKECILRYLETRNDNIPALFISREGNRLSVRAIQDFVKNVGKKAGVEKNIHPHLFRHGNAMLLLDNGMPLDEIQKVLGHENIATTQIYAQTSMKRVKENVDNIFDKIS